MDGTFRGISKVANVQKTIPFQLKKFLQSLPAEVEQVYLSPNYGENILERTKHFQATLPNQGSCHSNSSGRAILFNCAFRAMQMNTISFQIFVFWVSLKTISIKLAVIEQVYGSILTFEPQVVANMYTQY